jgi:hypothetical protein
LEDLPRTTQVSTIEAIVDSGIELDQETLVGFASDYFDIDRGRFEVLEN